MADSIDAARHDCSTSMQEPLLHTLLIVEDEGLPLQRLVREMEARDFKVTTAISVADGLAKIRLNAPAYALVEMRLHDGCGLNVISALKQQRPDARAIIQTGYGNIATPSAQ